VVLQPAREIIQPFQGGLAIAALDAPCQTRRRGARYGMLPLVPFIKRAFGGAHLALLMGEMLRGMGEQIVQQGLHGDRCRVRDHRTAQILR
jgi:hypothetical protein